MQDKELFKEFVEFCRAQPTDKEIHHSSWSSCAVGEFARTKGISTDNNQSLGPVDMDLELNNFIGQLIGVTPVEGMYKSELGFNISRIFNDHDTYGEFTSFLEKYL